MFLSDIKREAYFPAKVTSFTLKCHLFSMFSFIVFVKSLHHVSETVVNILKMVAILNFYVHPMCNAFVMYSLNLSRTYIYVSFTHTSSGVSLALTVFTSPNSA